MANPTARSDEALATTNRIISRGDHAKKYLQMRLIGPPGFPPWFTFRTLPVAVVAG